MAQKKKLGMCQWLHSICHIYSVPGAGWLGQGAMNFVFLNSAINNKPLIYSHHSLASILWTLIRLNIFYVLFNKCFWNFSILQMFSFKMLLYRYFQKYSLKMNGINSPCYIGCLSPFFILVLEAPILEMIKGFYIVTLCG